MTICIKNYDLSTKLAGMKSLYTSDKAMPATAAYSIVKAIATMQDAASPFIMVRDQLVRRYSGGKDVLSQDDDPEAYAACIKELDEIGNKTVNIELPEIELKDLAGVNFTPKEMESLQMIIKQ